MKDDLISRQAAIDTLKMDISIIPFAKAREYVREAIETIYNRLEDLPSAQTERKKGKWINRRLIYMDVHIATCDQCGKRVVVGNFCHNCGADMRGELDDEQRSC